MGINFLFNNSFHFRSQGLCQKLLHSWGNNQTEAFEQIVKITEFDKEKFHIKSSGWGEPFDISKHPQGTEVKAITYSNMQIHENEHMHELFVIIDI
ncbi:uncharacterized protein DC041_0000446 [Schistosoma bovis]|uniref:Archease domain-containing protein n=1 Tax=Schistosoma bovis TaxID=6184 RepID=A0A430Q9E1_SCHBO|nr:uncharacterized protein DC041_0000446 [Schistosoma bovis]